jgi:hypothetical protein
MTVHIRTVILVRFGCQLFSTNAILKLTFLPKST